MNSAPLSEDFISMEEMFNAYRKAKTDTFYERSQLCAVDFVYFENDLWNNLEKLRNLLTARQPAKKTVKTIPKAWYDDIAFIGGHSFIPKTLKKLTIPDRSKNPNDRLVYSDPWDEWKCVHESPQPQFVPEFRPIADMTVNMHIVCALWINLVGEKFDRCLDSCCRGSRLRRIASSQMQTVSSLSDEEPDPGTYHKNAIGSFEPYFVRYRQWRDEGFQAINEALDSGKRIVAITMDVAKFYHRVDPEFLLSPSFLEICGFKKRNKADLSIDEHHFTEQLITSLKTWGESLPTYDPTQPIGLPVCTSVASVIANVLLVEFDRLVRERLAPVYYARYVDDVFLVLNDSDRIKSRKDLIDKLCLSTGILVRDETTSDEVLRLKLPYANKSLLEFRGDKQRVFILRGEMGRDFVETIRSRIDEVSSEWRLMPDLDDISKSPAGRVLTANRTPDEEADSLRKADSLSLRRLGFASLLRSMDAASRDLPPNEWREQRHARYEFACRHIVTPLRLFDFESYLPRLLSIAVECRDWKWANKMVSQLALTVDELQTKLASGESQLFESWIGFRRHLRISLQLAVYRSMFWTPKDNKDASKLIENIGRLQPHKLQLNKWLDPLMVFDPIIHSKQLWAADLAKRPFKDGLLQYDELSSSRLSELSKAVPTSGITWQREEADRVARLQEVAAEIAAKLSGINAALLLRPLLYPTRALTPAEVTDCLPSLIQDTSRFAYVVRLLRGTHVKSTADSNGEDFQTIKGDLSAIEIGEDHKRTRTRVAVTSWSVDELSWSGAASGKPDLSINRYQRLVELANSITKKHWTEKPQYVVFPELSIPRRWLPGLAQHFLRQQISLIAGAEYRRNGASVGEVLNEAKMFLTDNRLGYSHGCVITQQKGLPAHGERDKLREMFGLKFAPESGDCTKRVYRHFGFEFGVLVCSELTNIKFRKEFRGQVDALFVLAWNRDLDSFASLVESTALDVHCYVILANNPKYGDSRIRTPHIQNWLRDLVRLKGGLEDYFVVSEIDVYGLREFQSHFEPPVGVDAVFKPFPEGFKISESREKWSRTNKLEEM